MERVGAFTGRQRCTNPFPFLSRMKAAWGGACASMLPWLITVVSANASPACEVPPVLEKAVADGGQMEEMDYGHDFICQKQDETGQLENDTRWQLRGFHLASDEQQLIQYAPMEESAGRNLPGEQNGKCDDLYVDMSLGHGDDIDKPHSEHDWINEISKFAW